MDDTIYIHPETILLPIFQRNGTANPAHVRILSVSSHLVGLLIPYYFQVPEIGISTISVRTNYVRVQTSRRIIRNNQVLRRREENLAQLPIRFGHTGLHMMMYQKIVTTARTDGCRYKSMSATSSAAALIFFLAEFIAKREAERVLTVLLITNYIPAMPFRELILRISAPIAE
jgi:hypothetical protein